MLPSADEQLPAVSIVIPVYNEERAIAPVVTELAARYPEIEIVVVDDGSTDASAALLAGLPCRVVRHDGNRGYGASWKSGCRAARGEIVVFFDGDGQFDPDDVGRLLAHMRETDADVTVGARAGTAGSPLRRRPGKLVLKALAQFLARQQIRDLNCGMRAVRRRVLLRYLHLLPDGISASSTSTLVFLKRGYKLTFVPIRVRPRIGVSSVRMFRDGFNTALTITRIIALFDPLRIFLPMAALLLGFSVVYSVYEAIRAGLGVPVLGAVLFLAGLLSFLLGILCDQISALRLERYEEPGDTGR